MSDSVKLTEAIDVAALERLATQLKEDAARGAGLSRAAVLSVATIIEAAIGAPLSWPSREAGVAYADEVYPGSPTHRAGFNHGVKWAVERFQPTIEPSDRFGRRALIARAEEQTP